MDWVPMAFYGDDIVLAGGPGGTTGYVILYPVPDYGLVDEEFLYEDQEETGLFLERIIGSVHMSSTSPGGHTVAWQLMPLGVEYDTPAVLPPFTVGWSPRDSNWANLRFWERKERTLDPPNYTYPAPQEDPSWTFVDIHPRQLMGAKHNLWPVLCVHNADAVYGVRLHHTLRALYK